MVHGITRLNQVNGTAVARNLIINFGHMCMEEILENQKLGQKFCLYPRFLQIVLDGKLSDVYKALFNGEKTIDPIILSRKIVQGLINYREYPNNNSNRPQVTLTDFIRDYFGVIVQRVQQ